MRLKFEKGMTPEAIAKIFVQFMRENDVIIGTVNMYIQTYDDEMKLQNTNDFFVCKPCDATKHDYEDDVVNERRRKIKVV